MLCPEVWKFPINEKKIFHKFGSYDNKGNQTLNSTLKSSPINSMVSLVLPGQESIPESIKQLIGESDYYLIRNLKLGELIRKDFIELFIKQGKLTGSSLNDTHINNSEDVFIISPEGKLILLITKEIYETIGLEGHPVEYSKRNKDRFEITINLKKENTSDQSKSYKRIQNTLSRVDITFDLNLHWEPDSSSICPSSVAKFFADSGYEVEQHNLRLLSVLRDDLRLPKGIFPQQNLSSDLVNPLIEYIGMLILGCEIRSTSEELNSYNIDPELNIQNQSAAKAVVLHCRGLITFEFISKLINAARQSVNSELLILSVSGFDKASRTGLNSYVALFDDKKYLLLKA